MSQRRTRPRKILSMAEETWARIEEIADRWGMSRSATVERMARETALPPRLRPAAG